METVTLEEARAHLAGLVDRVAQGGEEIVITRDDRPVAKLVALPGTRARPRFGSAKGLIEISEDFDAPLEDFKEYS
jgi:prevent-host-death family protein